MQLIGSLFFIPAFCWAALGIWWHRISEESSEESGYISPLRRTIFFIFGTCLLPALIPPHPSAPVSQHFSSSWNIPSHPPVTAILTTSTTSTTTAYTTTTTIITIIITNPPPPSSTRSSAHLPSWPCITTAKYTIASRLLTVLALILLLKSHHHFLRRDGFRLRLLRSVPGEIGC